MSGCPIKANPVDPKCYKQENDGGNAICSMNLYMTAQCSNPMTSIRKRPYHAPFALEVKERSARGKFPSMRGSDVRTKQDGRCTSF
jgi:hypothetical protein